MRYGHFDNEEREHVIDGVDVPVKVESPKSVCKGVESVTVSNKAVAGAVPVQAKGSLNDLAVVMG
jgi:N,N'-diacetylchitobiose phosphorylase